MRMAEKTLLDGGPNAFASAAGLYEVAAKKGNPVAAFDLGYFYENGLGVGKDPAQARHWFSEAAKLSTDPKLRSMATKSADTTENDGPS